jgi:transcriptional regulator with XRE-family HTH domain
MSKGSSSNRERGRGRPENIDRHVGERVRERRIMLGLSQHQFAELIGVTFQQAHKYEKGMAAGRLYKAAQVLGVDVGYFFDGIGGNDPFRPTQQQRQLGVSSHQVHRLERGIDRLSATQLLALAQAFEVVAGNLFDGYHSGAPLSTRLMTPRPRGCCSR